MSDENQTTPTPVADQATEAAPAVVNTPVEVNTPQPAAPVAPVDPPAQEPAQDPAGAVVAAVETEAVAAGDGILQHIHDRVEWFVARLEAGLHVPIDDVRALLAKIKSAL